MVEVVVRMSKDGRTATAMGLREDIVMASVEAVLGGMNVLTVDYSAETATKKKNKDLRKTRRTKAF
jgi:hypothetical protein